MKIVAVSQRVDIWKERNETRDALDQKLFLWLQEAGFLPVPVPNVLSSETLKKWLHEIRPSAILLSGGNDIGVFPERDHIESELLKFAEWKNKPVLGLCRGMQMMVIAYNGTLKPIEGHVGLRHRLFFEKNRSDFPTEVNSYHNFTIDMCPSQFEVLATTEDGAIEAIQHKNLPWEGWMWHPERELEFNKTDTTRLRGLFHAQ